MSLSIVPSSLFLTPISSNMLISDGVCAPTATLCCSQINSLNVGAFFPACYFRLMGDRKMERVEKGSGCGVGLQHSTVCHSPNGPFAAP